MSGHRYFFATKSDLAPGIRVSEAQRRLKYTLATDYKEPKLEVFTSFLAFLTSAWPLREPRCRKKNIW